MRGGKGSRNMTQTAHTTTDRGNTLCGVNFDPAVTRWGGEYLTPDPDGKQCDDCTAMADFVRLDSDGKVQTCVICALTLHTNEGYFYGAHPKCARVAVQRASR